jgi:hypothetical protein
MRGSELSTKAAKQKGGIRAETFLSGPQPSCYPRPRFGSRLFSGRMARRAATKGCSVYQAGLEVEEHRAGNAHATHGLVVKHVDAAKLRVAVR